MLGLLSDVVHVFRRVNSTHSSPRCHVWTTEPQSGSLTMTQVAVCYDLLCIADELSMQISALYLH